MNQPPYLNAMLYPAVRLVGPIDDAMVDRFVQAFSEATKMGGPIAIELSTQGGSPESARRIAADIELFQRRQGSKILFIGKGSVMSAGVVIMAAFARQDRFLTPGTTVLIHERRLQRTIDLTGPLRSSIQQVREVLAELEFSRELERQGFAELVRDTKISPAELDELAATSVYWSAEECLERELIGGIL